MEEPPAKSDAEMEWKLFRAKLDGQREGLAVGLTIGFGCVLIGIVLTALFFG